MNKILIYIVIFLVILNLGLLGYYFYSSGSLKTLFSASPPQHGVGNLPEVELQSYKGEVVCLSIKSGANAEEEGCVLGLKDENDKYYALYGKNLDSMLQENTSAVIWGYLKNGSYADYDVVGFIEVTKAEKQ